MTELCRIYLKLAKTNHIQRLGMRSTGNHFIEVYVDKAGFVWLMLHSGSRGVGNFSGTVSIEQRVVRVVFAQRRARDETR